MKDSSGKYRLTLRFYEIGSRVSGVSDLLSAARPMLDHLADSCGEAVHLVERDGNDIVYLYKAEPRQQMVRMSSCVGLRNPMYCTGVGKSILALLPEEQITEIWNGTDIRAYTPHTITDRQELLLHLQETRKRGYAIDNEEHETGVRCVAMAIRNSYGLPFAAVSVAAPAQRMDDQRIALLVPSLSSICDELSRVMGKRADFS